MWTTMLHANTQFDEAASATIEVAGTLFGTAEAQAVEGAWREVGVLP